MNDKTNPTDDCTQPKKPTTMTAPEAVGSGDTSPGYATRKDAYLGAVANHNEDNLGMVGRENDAYLIKKMIAACEGFEDLEDCMLAALVAIRPYTAAHENGLQSIAWGERITNILHYPEHWDAVKYPTVYDAIEAIAACNVCPSGD